MEEIVVRTAVNTLDPVILLVAVVTAALIRNKPYRFFWIPAMTVSSNLALHALLNGGGSPAPASVAGSFLVGLIVALIVSRLFTARPDHN